MKMTSMHHVYVCHVVRAAYAHAHVHVRARRDNWCADRFNWGVINADRARVDSGGTADADSDPDPDDSENKTEGVGPILHRIIGQLF